MVVMGNGGSGSCSVSTDKSLLRDKNDERRAASSKQRDEHKLGYRARAAVVMASVARRRGRRALHRGRRPHASTRRRLMQHDLALAQRRRRARVPPLVLHSARLLLHRRRPRHRRRELHPARTVRADGARVRRERHRQRRARRVRPRLQRLAALGRVRVRRRLLVERHGRVARRRRRRPPGAPARLRRHARLRDAPHARPLVLVVLDARPGAQWPFGTGHWRRRARRHRRPAMDELR